MDPGILLGALALSIPIFAIWTKHRIKIAEIQSRATIKATAEKAAQYAQHSAQLEERVRVLERIVTDRGFDISAQIEALRDGRPAATALPSRDKEPTQ